MAEKKDPDPRPKCRACNGSGWQVPGEKPCPKCDGSGRDDKGYKYSAKKEAFVEK